MKNKKQLMFGTLALVLLSGIAASSTTLAWFTTTRTASLNFTSATIENKSSNLVVNYVESLNSFDTVDPTPNAIALTGGNKVTDISGDGLSFYKPVWADSNATVASVINDVTATADEHYIDFVLKISRDNTNAANPLGLKVYLGSGTKILPLDSGNAKDVDAVKASRMAVISYDDASRSNPAVVHLHAPEAEPAATATHLAVNASETAYGIAGYELKDVSTTLNSAAFNTATKQADATYEIADLTSDSEAYVGFRFWIEGTDAETTNAKALGGMFKVALDIYALEA